MKFVSKLHSCEVVSVPRRASQYILKGINLIVAWWALAKIYERNGVVRSFLMSCFLKIDTYQSLAPQGKPKGR